MFNDLDRCRKLCVKGHVHLINLKNMLKLSTVKSLQGVHVSLVRCSCLISIVSIYECVVVFSTFRNLFYFQCFPGSNSDTNNFKFTYILIKTYSNSITKMLNNMQAKEDCSISVFIN